MLKRMWWLFLVFFVHSGNVIAALTTVACPGDIDCIGDDYIVPAGEVRQNLKIYTLGSIRLGVGSVIFHSQQVCQGTAERDGVIASDYSKVIDFDQSGSCGKSGYAGISVVGVHGVELWEVRVRSSDGYGVMVRDAPGTKINGVFVTAAKLTGVMIRNSQDVDILASLVYVGVGATVLGFDIDALSTGRFGRSRARYNNGEIALTTLDGWRITANVCETELGAMRCAPNHFGSGDRYLWTVCQQNGGYPSYGNGGYCDFTDLQTAIDSPIVHDGDALIVDSPVITGVWPGVTIWKSLTVKAAVSGGTLGGKQEAAAQQGTYFYKVPIGEVIVTAPGVVLSGFRFDGALAVQPDTFVVETE